MLLRLYNLILRSAIVGVGIFRKLHPKLNRAIEGRRDLVRKVNQHYATVEPARRRVIVHVASFGELEQAKPVIERLKQIDPTTHVHVTFFSPSGYENAKNYKGADYLSYSPFDIRKNVREFLSASKPDLVLFTRYDVWPNFVHELHDRNIPTFLFSASTSDSRRFDGPLKNLHIETYKLLTAISVIAASDKEKLISLGIDGSRITQCGDTRFDRVRERSEKTLPILPRTVTERISKEKLLVFVTGSIWPSDDKILGKTIKESVRRGDKILFILASHEISKKRLRSMRKYYGVRSIEFSHLDRYSDEPIILVDSIGKLFSLYQYADIAYVGGGFGAGVHNTLEPAVYGAAIITGPRHARSQEIGELIGSGAAYEVKDSREFEFVFWRFVQDEDLRRTASQSARSLISSKSGASDCVVQKALELLGR